MKMREMLSKEGGSNQPTMRVVLGADGKPVAVEMGPTVPGETAGGTVPGPAAIPQPGAIGVSELGKVGEGMARTTTPEGAIVDTPIPGSEAALEREAAAAAEAAGTQRQTVNAASAIRAVDNAIERINWMSTGPVGQLTRNAWGSPSSALSGELATVASNLGFEELSAMRAASPNGAALGNITEKENVLLQATKASIAQSNDPEQLRQNLLYVRDLFEVMINTNPNDPASIDRYNKAVARIAEETGVPVFTLQDRGGPASTPMAVPPPPIDTPAPNVGTPTPAAPVPQAQPTAVTGLPSPTTPEEYNALPAGTQYTAPDGSVRTKK
jgi:hypothetical protein